MDPQCNIDFMHDITSRNSTRRFLLDRGSSSTLKNSGWLILEYKRCIDYFNNSLYHTFNFKIISNLIEEQ